ncbi:MAG: histidinol-phosphate transaminase [Pseudomonadota bacterium]
MSRLWSKAVEKLTPYVPGEQPAMRDLVKLNTNEHPYPPAPGVAAAITSLDMESVRRYPDPESCELRDALARRYGLSRDEVFVGNGSDEVLALAFQALFKQSSPLLFPDITYSFYPVWCQLYQIEWQTIPLLDDFRVDVDGFDRDNGGIIIPNPNAPTGILLSLDEVRTLLERNPNAVVAIDEAYIHFGGETACQLISEFDNLLVVQTMSKSWALAGLRVGMAMGNVQLIEALTRVKNSFNSYPLDIVAQKAGVAALTDEAYFESARNNVIASRERLTAAMTDLGFTVLPSGANFILARHPQSNAKELFEALREHSIIVRYFNSPRISDYLRISIGTDDQCDRLLQALAELLR